MCLRNRRYDDGNQKDICRGMCQLVVTGKREFNRYAKSLDRHDRERSDQGADADIDERVCWPAERRQAVDCIYSEDEDKGEIEKEYFCSQIVRN